MAILAESLSHSQSTKRDALVIGINKYNHIPNLQYATADAEAISQILEQHGNFEVERLPKYWNQDSNKYEVAEEPLTSKELGQALREFLLGKQKGTEALIYFSGHGASVPDVLGEQKGYIVTSDCNPTTIDTYGIPLDSLNELIRKADLKSLIVILDCCHAGYILEANLVKQTLSVFRSQTNYYLMAACGGSEVTYEGSIAGGGHGLFTHSLLEGLLKKNAGSDGQVSVDGLFDFICSQLRNQNFYRQVEPIRMGSGQSIPLVRYKSKQISVVIDETCPYQGLKAFNKSNSQFFFGRIQLIQILKEKLEESNFVPLIGASGSGKSSVVRAGLIPELEGYGWKILEPILPGNEPLLKLKQTFTQLFQKTTKKQENFKLIEQLLDLQLLIERLPGKERFLLVVDQFEEVFTLCTNEAEKRRFIDLLTEVTRIPTSRLAIVITMRADFLEPCLDYPLLNQLIEKYLILMPSLRGANLQQAIEEPARLQGYELERGLLGEILHDIGQERGSLPLLQFSLTQLWEVRNQQNHKLTVTQYKKLGGVIGSLNTHAEKIYQSLTKQEQDWVKWIFLRLVQTHIDGKDTRQRQPRLKVLGIIGDNLENRKSLGDVLDRLIAGRLLVTGQDITGEAWIDLTHEALIKGWERFNNWLEEDRELRQLIDRIEVELNYWLKNRLDENLMLGGWLARMRKRWSELKNYLPSEAEEFYRRSNEFEKEQLDRKEQRKAQLQELEAKFQDKAAKFLELADAQIKREDERTLNIETIKGRLKVFEPLPVLLTIDVPTDQEVTVLVNRSKDLQEHSSKRAGILFYNEPPDALFLAQMATVRLRDHFVLIPIPLAEIEKALLESACEGLLAEYVDRYLPGADLFDDRNAIGDTLSFFGRTDILHSLEEDLQRNQAIGLFGLRKSGKTSLLLQLRFALRQHPVVHIDLQTYGGKPRYGADLFNNILAQLHKLMSSHITPDSTVQLQPLPQDQPAVELTTEFASQVHQLARILNKAGYQLPILCFLDEIERILPTPADPKERAEEFNAFFGVLRSLSQEQRLLNILVTDVHPDCNRTNHWMESGIPTNPVCNFFKETFMPPFKEEDTERMLTDIGSLMGRQFDEQTLKTIHRKSGGHPFLARQLASLLCKKIPKNGDELITIQTAGRYLNRPLSYSGVLKNYFPQNIWADLVKRKFESAMNIFRVLACNEELELGVKRQAILKQLSFNFTQSQCLDGLIWLEDVGLVSRNETVDFDYYKTRMFLLSYWCRMQMREEEINKWKIR